MANLKRWTLADAGEMYNVRGWGQGYFGINAHGRMAAFPGGDAGREPARGGIDITEVIAAALEQGLSPPLLIRFSDMLSHRLGALHGAFAGAIAEHRYEGRFTGVYPLKVNQQRQVVEEVMRHGAAHAMGLEVGSKPELHAALAAQTSPHSMIVCNGFKDDAYIRLALLAQPLGPRIFLVVEKPGELEAILRVAGQEAIEPLLGFRVRLATPGSGRWEDSGGDASKFGLASWEVVEGVNRLRRAGVLHCLRLLHAHIGSQITNIRTVTEATREIARFYAELTAMGCPIDHVDVGGGLGVDYDGTRSTHGFSANYDEREYANEVVGMLAGVCREAELPHPHIICESGRALTAHHAMLVLNVLQASTLDPPPWESAGEDLPEPAQRMGRLLAGMNANNVSGFWAEAQLLRDEANRRFEFGTLSLSHRAGIDRAFWAVARRAERLKRRLKRVPEELEILDSLLADKYYCNFSVFQSLPDAWAIHQEFPVVPLHRLGEKPTRTAILQDLTCDSDGQLVNYIGPTGPAGTLPLHPLRDEEPYYLGVFLAGAYQEILGDLHNLFGDTDTVHVAGVGGGDGGQEDGGWHCGQVIAGESVSRVLETVGFDRGEMTRSIDRRAAAAVKDGSMTPAQARAFGALYRRGLDGPTYLEDGRTATSANAAKRSEGAKTATAAGLPRPRGSRAG